ncbi:hypothetical protein N9D02_10505 [Emcibacteraceae bacterium]|jgi:hypothetical protein|nr:hypothetical protein [Emcibacteraceae bacterium]
MANTTFNGPVRSKNGFKDITSNSNTGAVTENISISHDGTNSVVIIKDLPTADPSVAGQIYSNSGVLTVSAG